MQKTEATLIELTVIEPTGPWSWYSSCPEALLDESTFAFPPNDALSVLSAMIQPPSVMFVVHSGVLAVPVRKLLSMARPSISF